MIIIQRVFVNIVGGEKMDEYPNDECPACLDPMDYCQGHGEISDPEGFAVLQELE